MTVMSIQGRMCLLLGPPGSGKSTMLKALAGKIQTSNLLKVRGLFNFKTSLCSQTFCRP